MELHKLKAHQLHDKLKAKEVSAAEVTEAVYDRIAAVEDKVRAYITLTRETALEQARRVDADEHDHAAVPGAYLPEKLHVTVVQVVDLESSHDDPVAWLHLSLPRNATAMARRKTIAMNVSAVVKRTKTYACEMKKYATRRNSAVKKPR